MKVSIYYLYSANNAGDMAICLGLLDLLSTIPNTSIRFISRFTEKDPEFNESKILINKYFPKVEVVPGYIKFSRDSNIFSKIVSHIKGLFISLFPFLKPTIKDDVKDADLVLLNGGNFLRCNSVADYLRLKAMFIPLKVAKKMSKNIVCMPQSTSACKKNFLRKILKKYLSIFDHVFARENETYNYFLKNNLVDLNKLSLTCDLAFFTKKFEEKNAVKNNYKKQIAFNMRTTGIGDIGHIDRIKEKSIYETFERMVVDNPTAYFSLICQTKKDYDSMHSFYAELKERNISNINFIEDHNPYFLKNIYANQDLVISMRLHASILSISSGTNVVGFTFPEWGFKNKGILEQFDMLNFSKGNEILDIISNKKVYENNTKLILSKIEKFKSEILSILLIYLN